MGAHTGIDSFISTILSLTVMGTPTLVLVPTVITNGSLVFNSSTSCIFFVPTTLSNNSVLILRLFHIGGKLSGLPITLPSKESDFVVAGSRLVPIATNPPGPRFFLEIPLCKLSTSVVIASIPFFVVPMSSLPLES